MNRADLDLALIRNALDSHLRSLQVSEDEYRKGNNPEGAETMRREWHRVNDQRQIIENLIRSER